MKTNSKTLQVLLWIVCSLFMTGCRNMKVKYEGFSSSPSASMRLVESDLRKYMAEVPGAANRDYLFCLDQTITDGSFGFQLKDNQVRMFGGDEIGVTHAFYTLLEELGYTFDVTGVSVPAVKKDLSLLTDKSITPKVRWRGIRQHVNFPMDISSYSINDAKEYINSLLRMRFNKIAFHSYPGQWYETQVGDSLALAGNFFYGDTHFMYDSEFLKKHISTNDSVFCIPEAEPIFTDPGKRSRFAVAWMQELVNYAADLGFYVQMSFEPRLASVDQAVQTAEDIRKTYPRINALEMITEETGGWGPRCTAEEVKNTLKTYFPNEIANDSIVCAPIQPQQTDLNALYTQVGIITQAIGQLQAKEVFGPELKLGIYSTITRYTNGAYRLARLTLPETQICLMASHGSGGTATAVADLIRTADDMRHTEIYSWIEFDGLMYLYQNSIDGNARLMEHIGKLLPEEQQGSILYNHWRTAENRTSARYAMTSTLEGETIPDVFYEQYAGRLAIKDVEKYKKILALLQQANDHSRTYLGNIGFCWMGAWRSGGSFPWMNKEHVQTARTYYFEAGQLLAELIAQVDKTSPAYDYLAFMGNRVLCSVIYMDAFLEAAEIRTIRKEADGSVSESEKLRAQEICNRALLLFDQYMETHAQMMPDRGCEGTLVSIWNAPIRGLKVYRSQLGGVAPEELPHSDTPVDAPPLPIFYND